MKTDVFIKATGHDMKWTSCSLVFAWYRGSLVRDQLQALCCVHEQDTCPLL